MGKHAQQHIPRDQQESLFPRKLPKAEQPAQGNSKHWPQHKFTISPIDQGIDSGGLEHKNTADAQLCQKAEHYKN